MAKINKQLKEQKRDGSTVKRVSIAGDPFDQLSWVIRPTYGEGEPNIVTVYRLDQEIEVVKNVRFGDVIDLIYQKKDDAFKVRKVELPLDEGELILWLFGLPKKWRAKTAEEYQAMLNERLTMFCKDGEPPYWKKEFLVFGGKFTFAKKTVGSEPICLTGRVLTGLADEAMREIVRNEELRNLLAYDSVSVREIAKSRLGLVQEDFNEAHF